MDDRVPGFLPALDAPDDPVHDSERVVGRIPVYSYRDELPPPRPTIEPVSATWGDVAGALAGLVVLGIFFLVLFVLWPISQAQP